MKIKYLLRLDDACPTMDSSKWLRMEAVLDSFNIRPMVGVIPHNEDSKQCIDPDDPDFWIKVNLWNKKGWALALHGYNHCYISQKGMIGLNPMWKKSEFSGVEYDIQCQKIRCGYDILNSHGVNPKYFFAPSHTFDLNTLKALKENTEIRIISDTIATKPYCKYGFSFIPQVGGHCRKILIPGIWTFCFHPSTMKDDDFKSLELFLEHNKESFISFDQLDLSNLKRKSIISNIISWIYFKVRKLKTNN